MSRRPGAADFLLAGACLVWGTNFVVVKSALTEFSPLAFNGLRFAIASVVLLCLQWRAGGLSVLRPFLGRIIVLGVVGNLCYQMLFIYGLDRTQASQAGFFTSTTPLWVLLLARLTGHDRFDRRVVVGIGLAAVGVLLLLRESFYGSGSEQRFWVGNLLLLGASASWAWYTVYSQPLLQELRPLAVTSATMAAGAIPLFLVAIPDISTIRAAEISAPSWAGLLYSTLMALVFGYLAWVRGVREIGSARTSVYVNMIPLVAAGTAWVRLGERLSGRQLVGAAAVICGIGLSRRLSPGAGATPVSKAIER